MKIFLLYFRNSKWRIQYGGDLFDKSLDLAKICPSLAKPMNGDCEDCPCFLFTDFNFLKLHI